MAKGSQYQRMTTLTGAERFLGIQGTATETATADDLAAFAAVQAGAVTLPLLASDQGSDLIGFEQEGGALRTTQDRLRETATPTDFGAVGDGVTSSTAAFQSALNSAPKNAAVPYSPTPYVVGALSVPSGGGLTGDRQLSSTLTQSAGITVDGAFTQITGLRLSSADQLFPQVTYVANSYNNFGNLLRDVRFSGLNGIDNNAIETKLWNIYGVGRGDTSAGIALDISNWDTSAFGVIFQDYGKGVYSNKGFQGCDIHLVRCGTGLDVRDQGHPVQLVNTYLDTPRQYGAAFFNQSGATLTATYVLNVGHADTAATATGFYFDTAGDNNLFGVHFQQNDPATYVGGFRFNAGIKNNLLAGVSGSYKVASANPFWLQHVFAGHGGWARHNNYARKNRARTASSVAPGGTTTLVFTMDWVHPTLTFDTLLFVGHYASRNSNSQGNVGRLIIPIQFGDTGCTPTLEKVTGHANNVWAITAASLLNDELSITFQNNGTSNATLSAEISRSVDSNGSCF